MTGTKPESITVFSHGRPDETGEAVRRLVDAAVAAGIRVCVPADEVEKHGLEPRDGVDLGVDPDAPCGLAAVFGGDGTILAALRRFAGTGVPVFAFNYGKVGFLSTVDHDDLLEGVRRATTGDFDLVALPALVVDLGGRSAVGVNDIAFQRGTARRVAHLAYSVEGEELGQVRCDGLVASTPAGSTGYNLANGGPLLAWGVEGFVVSFIAPHTLTARTLVVATEDVLEVTNLSDTDAVDMTADGQIAAPLGPGESMQLRFQHDCAQLAQLPGASFYHRLRERFGRLAY